jgi:hypothetical protein
MLSLNSVGCPHKTSTLLRNYAHGNIWFEGSMMISQNIKFKKTEYWPQLPLDLIAYSNTGIVGSNPSRSMDVHVFSAFVFFCVGTGLVTASVV